MLEALVQFSIRQRMVIFILTAALIGSGLYAFQQLPIEAFPDVLNETVQVITLANGLSAKDVERQITIPLEREFSGLPRLAKSRSISEFGLSVVYLQFEEGVNGYWARTQVREKISTAEVAEQFQPDLAPMASVTGEILRYELRGVGMNTTELRSLQEWTLEKQFRSVPGVADMINYGGKLRAWDVLIDPLKLSTFGITLNQVFDAIGKTNRNSAGNLIQYPNQAFVVRSIGFFQSKEDIEDVAVLASGTSVVRVRDIGRVVESFVPPRGVVGRDDRDDIVQGIVLLRKGENPVQVGKALRERLEEMKSSPLMPEGVRLDVFYDRIELVEKTTHTVVNNLFHGFLFVVVVLFLFLRNWQATVLVACVVPLSLCFSFVCIWLSGTPANLISLGAIDFGIIVDGAVIVTEYVLSQFEQVSDRREFDRRLEGINSIISTVIRPVFVSMTMIIVAYLPIFTLQNVEGKTFRPLAWTVSYALLGALIVGFTFVPALLPTVISRSLRKPHAEARWLERLRDYYFKYLQMFLQKPRRVWALCGGLIFVAALSLTFMGTEFLPELDEGALWIRARFPLSMNLQQGTELAREVRRALREQPEVQTVLSQLGGPEDGQDPTLFDNCEFFVDLRPKDEWKRFHHNRNELIEGYRQLLAGFPGVNFNVSQPIADNVEEAISGVKGKNAIKIFGPSLSVLAEKADEFERALAKIPGVVDLSLISVMPPVPHLTIRPNRTRIAQLGLTSQDVADVTEMAIGGRVVTTVALGEQFVDVILRAPESYRKTLEDIRAFPLVNNKGARLRLDQTSDIRFDSDPLAIYRENMARRIGVKFNIDGRDLGSVMKDVDKVIKNVELPTGYRVEVGGESQNQKRAMSRLAVVIPLTLFFLAGLLFLLFQDLATVGLCLAVLILSVSGSLLLLWLRGLAFSVSAAVGLLALFGVVSLEVITLANTYLRERSESKDAWDLIQQICQSRFRPIVMTSSLAALGLLPTALSHGIGSETQKPLATAVIGGLVTGLPCVLFLLPILLYWLEQFRTRDATSPADAS